jgi:UPF0755 protein
MVTKRSVVVTIQLLFLSLAIGMIAAWASFYYLPVVSDNQGVRFIVHEGASLHSVMNDLQKKNIIKYPIIYSLFFRYQQNGQTLKAGEYLFPQGSTPSSLLTQIKTGTGLVYHMFTIVPGWSFKQIREALQRNEQVDHLSQPLTDHEIMTQLGQADLNPEGEFYPDTYYFTSHYSDIKLLKRAFKAMQDKLSVAWNARAPNLPYKNLYEALIAASMIEKEARFDNDRPVIAGVLINRLHKDMLLQIDATVIYGLGASYDGKIHKSDLVLDTPYNSYLHKGLPPTPIAMPAIGSINAAMHPANHSFLYYVARGNGYHQFSTTLTEHHAAVSASTAISSDKTTVSPSSEFFNNDLVKAHLAKLIRI